MKNVKDSVKTFIMNHTILVAAIIIIILLIFGALLKALPCVIAFFVGYFLHLFIKTDFNDSQKIKR